jgi:hypothetical protein
MGRHSTDGPNETGVGPDGMRQPWQPASVWNQQPMPPCVRCGAPFSAHLDSRCPQTDTSSHQVTTEQRKARMQGSGQAPTSWATPLGGPPSLPLTTGPKLPWPKWPRPHQWLTWATRHKILTAIIAAALIGVVASVSAITSQNPSYALGYKYGRTGAFQAGYGQTTLAASPSQSLQYIANMYCAQMAEGAVMSGLDIGPSQDQWVKGCTAALLAQ